MSDSASVSRSARSSQFSHQSSVYVPSWAPPKSPLSPHRLAKLANALGVSTPIPAIHVLASSSSLSATNSVYAESARGLPSPSLSSTHSMSNFSPSTSKYLLHVVPPFKLPHNDDPMDSNSPPPPNTSGYHTQFRRGVFVPVHSTLQAELAAIAKEYALPSTAGLVLYLVSSGSRSQMSSPTPGQQDSLNFDEPGPRISEDIWKHLWTRVVKAEQNEDSITLPQRTLTPSSLGIGLGIGTRSTPQLLQDGFSRHIPEPITPSTQAFAYPSPSTPSSVSDMRYDSTSKETNSSSSFSRSGTDTPDTSVAASDRADSFDLPGLNSPSLIPILAKVEFDIDLRKAAWFEPWVRSRRANHAQRKGSLSVDSENRKPLISLQLPDRANAGPSWLKRDGDISESPVKQEEVASESEFDDDTTARITSFNDMEEILDAVEETLITMESGDDVAESTEVTTSMHRKNVPPPLILKKSPNASTSELLVPTPNTGSTPGGTSLPYLKTVSEEDLPSSAQQFMTDEDVAEEEEEELEFESEDYPRMKTPADSEKRGGGVYDDLDLGLDPSVDYDNNDPDDHRKSQLLLKVQLDAIERNLAQFSPRILSNDLEDEHEFNLSRSLSSNVLRNGDVFPPTPIHEQFDAEEEEGPAPPQWPAVPFSALGSPEQESRKSIDENKPPSPPSLAVNGVSTAAPKSYNPRSTGEVSAETRKRQKELEEEQKTAYPALTPRRKNPPSNSPIIPLSPDPFGRFSSDSSNTSSVYWEKPSHSVEAVLNGNPRASMETKSSRFSDDMENPKQPNRTTMMSVKSIRKLWRRSNKQSVSGMPLPTQQQTQPGQGQQPKLTVQTGPLKMDRMPSLSPIPPTPTLGSAPSHPPPRPERPSQETMDIPDIPEQLIIPTQLMPSRSSNPSPIIPSKMLPSGSSSVVHQLHFDQESPYPMHTRRPVNHSPRTPSLSSTPTSGSLADMQKQSVRKSILKWKSVASGGSSHQQTPSVSSTHSTASTQLPPSRSVPPANGARTRRPSVVNFATSRTSPSPDIPPSPNIPEQYLGQPQQQQHGRQYSHSSHLTSPSTDSSQFSPRLTASSARSASPQSLVSSQYSEDTRPSIDSSHFEMVSPKVGSLSYPYHSLDEELQ